MGRRSGGRSSRRKTARSWPTDCVRPGGCVMWGFALITRICSLITHDFTLIMPDLILLLRDLTFIMREFALIMGDSIWIAHDCSLASNTRSSG